MTSKERVEAVKAEMVEAQDKFVLTVAEELKKSGVRPLAYMPSLIGIGIVETVYEDWDNNTDEDKEYNLDKIRYNGEENGFEVHVQSIDGDEEDSWERLDSLNFTDADPIVILQTIQWDNPCDGEE